MKFNIICVKLHSNFFHRLGIHGIPLLLLRHIYLLLNLLYLIVILSLTSSNVFHKSFFYSLSYKSKFIIKKVLKFELPFLSNFIEKYNY